MAHMESQSRASTRLYLTIDDQSITWSHGLKALPIAKIRSIPFLTEYGMGDSVVVQSTDSVRRSSAQEQRYWEVHTYSDGSCPAGTRRCILVTYWTVFACL